MSPYLRPVIRRRAAVAASTLVAATMWTGEAVGQSLPVPVPTVPAAPTPTLPTVEVPSAPSAPVPVPVPTVDAPVPEVRTPELPSDPVPTVPSTPAVPEAPARVEAPSTPAGSDAPVPRTAPRVRAPGGGAPEGLDDLRPRGGGRSGGGGGGGGSGSGGGGGGGGSGSGGGGETRTGGGGPAGAPGGNGDALEVLGVSRRSGGEVRSGLARSDRFKRSASQRRLRRLLARRGDCLTRLPAVPRRVVLLRVGSDGRRPLSRRQVARRLEMSVRQVASEERRAITGLRSGPASCSGGGGREESAVLDSTVAPAGTAGGIDPGAAARGLGALLAGDTAAARAATGAAAGEVAGARMSGSESSADEAERDAGGTLETPLGALETTSPVSIAALSLLALLAALTVLLLVRRLRREQRTW